MRSLFKKVKDVCKMKNKLPEWKSNAELHVRTWILRLNELISVPVALLLILVLGSAYGMGFYTKSLALKEQFAELEANMQFTELQSLRMSNDWLKNRIAVLQEERAVLLETAVADLDKKSRIIESILSSVGVDIKVEVSNENSGGPFTSPVGDTGDELILRTDQYLDTIQNIPLGPPVPGVLTSRFGRRLDPINGESGDGQQPRASRRRGRGYPGVTPGRYAGAVAGLTAGYATSFRNSSIPPRCSSTLLNPAVWV